MKGDHRNKPNTEDELFEKEMGHVRRLNHKIAERPLPQRPSLSDAMSARRDIPTPIRDAEKFIRPGIHQSALRKLRRTPISHAATLDLHGHNAAEARRSLTEFVRQSRHKGVRTIRVIHGKGHGSAGSQPVLKAKVREWLQEFPAVLAFCSAPPEGGGTGAVNVLLK